ncbi:MAG: holo-ACP synthase [Candidatus Spyradosoma sp.]
MEKFPEKIGVGAAVKVPAGTNVVGVGIDLESVARVRAAIERSGDAFLEKVFSPEERALCRSRGAHAWESFAARWAAKEAFSKALGTGVGAEVGLTDFSVLCGERGEPRAVFSARGRAALENAGAADALVSLTHTAEFAEAVVILIR